MLHLSQSQVSICDLDNITDNLQEVYGSEGLNVITPTLVCIRIIISQSKICLIILSEVRWIELHFFSHHLSISINSIKSQKFKKALGDTAQHNNRNIRCKIRWEACVFLQLSHYLLSSLVRHICYSPNIMSSRRKHTKNKHLSNLTD